MSLQSRFEFAARETKFWERGIKPSFQPWIDEWKEKQKPVRDLKEIYNDLGQEFKRTFMAHMTPYRLIGGLVASTARFGYNFVKGPA